MKDAQPNTPWWKPALELFLDVSFWIAGPLVLALILGKWLDQKFGTKPLLLLASLAVSFIFSNILLLKKGKKAIQEFENESKEKDQRKDREEET